MQTFCKVVNNHVVEGPVLLPVSLENASENQVRNAGYLPVVKISPESFDSMMEVMLPPVFQVQPDSVRIIYSKRAKTMDELAADLHAKKHQVTTMKYELMKECNDVMTSPEWNSMQSGLKAEWQTYLSEIQHVDNN